MLEDELKTPPYPTLDTTGWVTKPEIKADAVLLGYLQANYSQSVIFYGKVTSFQATIQRCLPDVVELQSEVVKECNKLFGSYFDLADVRCDVTDKGKEAAGSGVAVLDVSIYVDVLQDGKRVSLGKLLSIIDGKVKAITPLE